MPLPLPDLDDRRWADLVDEARALLPRLAPTWTDLNYSDPGVTLVELLGWITEADLYRVNRIPRRHRRMFLALLGISPAPAVPARSIVAVRAVGGQPSLPAGTAIEAVPASDGSSTPAPIGHRTDADLQVLGCALRAVRVATVASTSADLSATLAHGQPIDAFGTDPCGCAHDPDAPALLLGFDADTPLPPGARLSMWLTLDDAATADLAAVPPDAPHHAIRTAWEFYDGTAWSAFSAVTAADATVTDETRCLTRSGAVVVPFDGTLTTPAVLGDGPPLRWLRCRLLGGRPDTAPRVFAITTDATSTTQVMPIATLEVGRSDGLPGFACVLPGAPVLASSLELWVTPTSGAPESWTVVDDLARSGPGDPAVALDPESGLLTFGDGSSGRIPPADAVITGSYQRTLGAAGTARDRQAWRLGTPVDPGVTVTARNWIGGLDIEDLESAEGRAADRMWAHERLLEIAPAGDTPTLDQVDPALVVTRSRPERAVTTVDLERIALEVPGTGVLRAHAWAGVDPSYPTESAPGTVTVVVVPGLPAGRPEPTPELLCVLRRYLAPRRTLGTRLLVVGPSYREVSVTASVTARRGADPVRVQASVSTHLRTFLDPLIGGPAGLGWPFGRDVYRAEILQQLDIVPGVDHVDSLELTAPGTEPGCGNVCVGPLELVVSGTHTIAVDAGGVIR